MVVEDEAASPHAVIASPMAGAVRLTPRATGKGHHENTRKSSPVAVESSLYADALSTRRTAFLRFWLGLLKAGTGSCRLSPLSALRAILAVPTCPGLTSDH